MSANPRGPRLSPRAAAVALQSLSPGHVPPPSRSQIMAENLMAAGERAKAMNPIRLASPAERAAKQHAIYGERAGLGELPPVEVVQPQEMRPRGASGESVELWINPPDRRQIPFGRDSIPVPNPRALTFGDYEMREDTAGSHTMKDQSRLAPLQGTPPMPDRNPGRAPTTGLTIARKGAGARMATPVEANQYLPDDDFWDRRQKDLAAVPLVVGESRKNLGSSYEQFADDQIWASRNPREAQEFAENVRAGRVEQALPGRQKHEVHADAVDNHFFERYGNWDREKIMRTLSQDLSGAGADALYWFTEPLGYLPGKSPKKSLHWVGMLPNLDGYMARRAQAHLGKPPPSRPKPKFTY